MLRTHLDTYEHKQRGNPPLFMYLRQNAKDFVIVHVLNSDRKRPASQEKYSSYQTRKV